MKSVLFNLAVIATLIVAVSNRSRNVKTQDGLNYRIRRSPVSKSSSLFGDESKENVRAPLVLVGRNRKNGFLTLPKGYNKLTLPLGDGVHVSPYVFVIFNLLIRKILDVDTKNGIIEIDTELGMTWIDWNVWRYYIENKEARAQVAQSAFPNDYLNLHAEFLKQIWQPDIFIEEMAGVERTFLLKQLIQLQFLVNNPLTPGAFDLRSKQVFRVRCDMDFAYFPADIQKCTLHIRSYSHSQHELFLLWNPHQQVYLDNTDNSNYNMQVSNVEPGEELYELFTKFDSNCCISRNFSSLKFTLQLRRNVKYHLIYTCLPSIILVLITWLCFLIPPDLAEARIGISMTTLLTFTAMLTAVREQSPQVSYTMAIDIWMVFCMLILFIALLLFTVIFWMRRRLESIRSKNRGDNSVENADLPSVTVPESDVKVSQLYISIMTNSNRMSFILFASILVIFLTVYFSWVMSASGYLDWEPSSKYNAIPLVDVDGNVYGTNPIFTESGRKFRANSTKKATESDFRFRDVFKYIIHPSLQASQNEKANETGENENKKDEVSSPEIETTTELAEFMETDDPGEAEINSTTIKPPNI